MQELESKYTSVDGLIKRLELHHVMDIKKARRIVYGWVASRKLPHSRIGKRLFFKIEDIDSFMESGRVLSVDEAMGAH